MSPYLSAGLVLLALTIVFGVIGMVLVTRHILRVKRAARYTQACTALLCLAFYAMAQGDWPGLHLRTVDFWSELLILAIVGYSVIWALLARLLNKPEYQRDFGDSFMLSMLYTDSQSPATELQARPDASGKQRP
jgi:cytochrome bd-type quinol oxidase subunit 2